MVHEYDSGRRFRKCTELSIYSYVLPIFGSIALLEQMYLTTTARWIAVRYPIGHVLV